MKAKILTTQSEKNQGVIGKESIEPDEIFIFVNIDSNQGFHMHSVPFPIDIAFLNQDYSVLDIQSMEPETGKSKAPHGTVCAVEACKDYFQKNDIKVNDFWKEIFNQIS